MHNLLHAINDGWVQVLSFVFASFSAPHCVFCIFECDLVLGLRSFLCSFLLPFFKIYLFIYFCIVFISNLTIDEIWMLIQSVPIGVRTQPIYKGPNVSRVNQHPPWVAHTKEEGKIQICQQSSTKPGRQKIPTFCSACQCSPPSELWHFV